MIKSISCSSTFNDTTTQRLAIFMRNASDSHLLIKSRSLLLRVKIPPIRAGIGADEKWNITTMSLTVVANFLLPATKSPTSLTKNATECFSPFLICEVNRSAIFFGSHLSTHIAGPLAYTNSSGVITPENIFLASFRCRKCCNSIIIKITYRAFLTGRLEKCLVGCNALPY